MSFVEEYKNAEYLELIVVRDKLIAYIHEYEKKDLEGDRSGKEWMSNPGPDVIYQVYLEYLGELCALMKNRYNADYVWGDKKLSEDYKRANT